MEHQEERHKYCQPEKWKKQTKKLDESKSLKIESGVLI